ncbi:DNA recombination protein RmuC [Patescibacteria group bacterium]|nr:DNA recombination protein RmuC [Patescibacteria group bacterium]
MSLEFIILIIVIIAGFAILFWLIGKKKKDISQDQSLLMLQNQINEVTKTLDSKLGESTKILQTQFGQSTKIIQDVTERLTKLDETNKQVVNFADQLKNLQDILKNPKQRGVLGEYYLETVLKNVLPPKSYQMQYSFKNGEMVDAVVFVKDKIIPIDSKFSLENYERILSAQDTGEREKLEKLFKQDLKNRIDETSKYIKPSENTMDFAFMFIPSEAIYYDLLINKVGAVQVNTQDLIEYAFKEKHVIIVSPTSFLAYLQTVLQGLRALQIEESAKEIRKNVEMLGKHILNYNEYLKKLGNNLGTVVNTYNTAYNEFKKIDKDVVKITSGESKIEPQVLDKPKVE